MFLSLFIFSPLLLHVFAYFSSPSPPQAYSTLLLLLSLTPRFFHDLLLLSPIFFFNPFSIPSTSVSFLLHFIFPPPLLKLSPSIHHLPKFRLLLPPSPQVSSNLVLLLSSIPPLPHLSSAHPLSRLLLRDQMDVN